MFQLKVISASVWRTNTSVLQRGKKKKRKKIKSHKTFWWVEGNFYSVL